MDGKDVTGEKGRIAYMPQQPALFPWRTVEDNVLLPEEREAPRKPLPGTCRWMERAGLSGFEKAYPHTLSGGMRRRFSARTDESAGSYVPGRTVQCIGCVNAQ